MKLTKEDFFKKYSDSNKIKISFEYNNIVITINDDWDLNREIQKYVLSSDNCYFIQLEYNEMTIRMED